MSDKVAIVTGGSRGIGRSIALKLAKEGYKIVIVARGEVQGIEDFGEIGRDFLHIKADISKASDRTNIVECVMKAFGRIDVLVNNAGVAPKVRADILEVSEESMDFVLGINLKGAFFLTQQVAKQMIKSLDEGEIKHPKIINITSLSAYTVSVNRPEYCISKAGMSMMSSLFASRLAEAGIFVYEIRPGIIETDMTSGVKEKYDALIDGGLTPIKRWGVPDDIGNAVAVLVSDKFLFSTGEIINIDGGFHIRSL